MIDMAENQILIHSDHDYADTMPTRITPRPIAIQQQLNKSLQIQNEINWKREQVIYFG